MDIGYSERMPKLNSRIRHVVGVPLAFGLLMTVQACVCSAGDWPRFLGPNGNNVSSETGLLSKWPADGVPLVWQKEIGSGYSAPSVLGNRVVLYHRVKDDEVVECFDSTTGQSLWWHSSPSEFSDPYGYNNGPRCTP